MKNKNIDYYGQNDNYIHLKFGNCRKCYNFTAEFIAKYPTFIREYQNYFEGNKSQFDNVMQVASFVKNNKIPVHFYYNFTDTPAKSNKEVMAYIIRENNKKNLHD